MQEVSEILNESMLLIQNPVKEITDNIKPDEQTLVGCEENIAPLSFIT